MVSTFTTVMLAVSTLAMFALILAGVIMFRKEKNFVRNMLLGFVLYFFTQITLTILIQLLGQSINGIVYFLMIAVNFLVMTYVFVLGISKFSKFKDLDYRQMTFGLMVMTVFQSLTTYLSYFMLSFAVNKNQVAEAYPDLTAENIQKLTDSIVSMTGFDVLLSVALLVATLVSSAFALKHIIRYVNGNKDNKYLVLAFGALLASNIIPEIVAMITGSMSMLVILAVIAVSAGIVYLDKKSI